MDEKEEEWSTAVIRRYSSFHLPYPRTLKRETGGEEAIRLEPRTGQPDFLLDVLLIESERLLEHTRELPDLSFEPFLVGPGPLRVQQLRWDALQRGGDRQVEGTKGLVLCLGEFTGVDAIDDSTGELERASGTGSVLAAGPASVDEPAVDLVFGHTVGQHLGVPSRLLKRD